VPAHLAAHDCLERPLSGWEVRYALTILAPALLMTIPRNRRRKCLFVLPKGPMSPYLMRRMVALYAGYMSLVLLIEDEDLALRILDEEEAGGSPRHVEVVRESLEQHAKHTSQEYDTCLIFDYTAVPKTVSLVPQVVKVCKHNAYVGHISRIYRSSDADDKELSALWKTTVRGSEDVLSIQLGHVIGSLIQTYVNSLRRPLVLASVAAGNSVNNAVGVVLGLSRDTNTRLRPYESYGSPVATTAIVGTEREAAENISVVREHRSRGLVLSFWPDDVDAWISRNVPVASPSTHKFRTFPLISKEASYESARVQQLLGGAVRTGPEAQAAGPRRERGENVCPRPGERE
jgi:hypothetical protein